MKILICGVGGRMGREVAKLALDGMRGAVPVAGFDVLPVDTREFPTYTDWNAVTELPDCIIDFSHHAGTAALLEYATAKKIPVVLATTGHTEEENAAIRRAAQSIPLFHSANMSLGIALLVELAKTAAKAFPEADIEIVEKHHNRKLDAPSGTALLLARELQEVREDATLICGRSGQAKREKNEIGIHAVRMGNIVGEHEVIIGTDTQTVTLKHEAHSRALFAEGAIAAADFLIGKPAGLYDMKRMIEEA
ncbi:MAG: 4-hydroxy-tetrahydrodipicolinate reductase [Clostridia bacterium]|nr:4-hydroxy-tetrahydrodipicolinate reductase [Clostridia bacterium]MBQ5834222.1 4-hydroxy-tetrahydrodipicolinate reductase [Clostridia bacterium]